MLVRAEDDKVTIVYGMSHTTSPAEYNPRYTQAMKTAVSLPEDIFQQAEAAARKLRMSRSQLYARAIAEFLEHSQTESVTARLNEVYAGKPARLDSAFHGAQVKSLPKDSW